MTIDWVLLNSFNRDQIVIWGKGCIVRRFKSELSVETKDGFVTAGPGDVIFRFGVYPNCDYVVYTKKNIPNG